MTNKYFTSYISQFAGGFFYLNNSPDFTSKYAPGIKSLDRPGRYFYILDRESKQYWSGTFQPTRRELSEYACRHFPSHTIINSKNNEIEFGVTIFQHPGAATEIWQAVLLNASSRRRNLSLFTAIEPSERFMYKAQFKNDALLLQDSEGESIFLSSNRNVDSYETDATQFLGLFRDLHDPIGVEDGKLSRGQVVADRPILVLQQNFILAPNASREINFYCGVCDTADKVHSTVRQTNKIGAVEELFAQITDSYESFRENFLIKSNEPWLDRINNYWLPTQLAHGNLSELQTNYYSSKLHSIESKARLINATNKYIDQSANIKEIFTYQDKDGTFAQGLSTQIAALSLINQYALEHGSKELLREEVRYRDGGKATLLEHYIRLITVTSRTVGKEQLNTSETLLNAVKYVTQIAESIPILNDLNEHALINVLSKLNDDIYSGINTKYKKVNKELSDELEIAGELAKYAPNSEFVKKSLARALSAADKSQSELRVSSYLTAIAGLLRVGSGDAALKRLEKLLTQGDNFIVEPFSTPDSVSKKGADGHWNTDAAAQLSEIISKYIFGLSATNGGLKIDPCISRDWKSVETTRNFRGATYNIRIINPFRLSSGVDRVTLNGTRIVGNVVTLRSRGVHYVEVYLG